MWPVETEAFLEQVGITRPIIQAPMAGGPTTPELIAAVSNAGGLGSLGAGYLPPAQIAAAIEAIRAKTDKPFAVNLFIPEVQPAEPPSPDVLTALARYATELGIEPPTIADAPAAIFEAQLAVLLEQQVPVFSFTFGVPSAAQMQTLQAHDIYTIGTATNLAEGQALAAAGCNAVVAQGSEAGGHRGGFLDATSAATVGGLALIPLLAERLSLPVIASGGIMDGRGLAAAVTLGAAAAQMGTAFLNCPEAQVHPAWRNVLQTTPETGTVLTRAFSGKYARGVANRFTQEMATLEDKAPVYPLQNSLTRPIRTAAKTQNKPEFMSLWAGQGLALSRSLPAAELVEVLEAEYADTVSRFRR